MKLQLALQRSRRFRILLALYAAYASMYLNRQIIAILAESLGHHLTLDDAELGTLTGSAFSIVFALLGLYFGLVADRRDRLAMVRLGALLWSGASCLGAAAPNFALLLLARSAVAVGEAVATAAAISLMADLSSVQRLGSTSGSFFASAYAGGGLAAILGGALISGVPVQFGIVGWRAAMLAAAIPGVLVAFMLRDSYGLTARMPAAVRGAPRRTLALGIVATAAIAITLQVCLPPLFGVPAAVALSGAAGAWWIRDIRSKDPAAFAATFARRAYRLWLLAFAAVLFIDFAAGFWLIPLAERRFGIATMTVGRDFGSWLIGGGILGAMGAGWIADAWQRHSGGAYVWTALAAVMLEALSVWAALEQMSYTDYRWAYAGFCIASGAWTGVAAAIGLQLIPAEHRGTGAAGYFFVTTLFGPGLGPFLIGLGSDALGSVAAALRLGTLAAVVAALALIALHRCMRDAPQSRPTVRWEA